MKLKLSRKKFCFMLNDFKICHEKLLKRSLKLSMNLRRTRKLYIEIYETINKLNLEFMKNMVKFLKLIEIRSETKIPAKLRNPKNPIKSLFALRVCIQNV